MTKEATVMAMLDDIILRATIATGYPPRLIHVSRSAKWAMMKELSTLETIMDHQPIKFRPDEMEYRGVRVRADLTAINETAAVFPR